MSQTGSEKIVKELSSTPGGLMLLASVHSINGCLDHVEKHVGQARECLEVVLAGKGMKRLKATGELKTHLEVIKGDMDRAILYL